MLRDIKHFLKITVIFFCVSPLSYCTDPPSQKSKIHNRQQNYIVISDLSDRIIKDSQQPQNDTAIIDHIYNRFLKSVKSHVYIKSHDRFVVVPIQEGKYINHSKFIENMSVDMKNILPKDRKRKENDRTIRINDALKKLYSNKGAIYSNKPDEYYGADIWKFFKDDLKDYLVNDSDFVNNIIILTDGYLFVDGKQKEITDIIEGVGQDFKQYNINVIVAEIAPKENRDDEWQALQNQWIEWLNGTGINNLKIVHKGAINQTLTKIDEFFSNPDKFKMLKEDVTNTVRGTVASPSKSIKTTKQNTVKIEKTKKDAKITPPSNESDLITKYNSVLVKESNREKRISYFVSEIYPKFNKISNMAGFKEMITNIKSDLKFLERKNAENEINGKKYSDYIQELKTYE
jgi:hypothetical protein